MTKLHLAENLDLPLEAVTEPIGIFANRGKGKSNAAHRLVEQLYHAELPSVVLDIKGDWYGIRSSADGTGPGLPFLIIGGVHGDVPLEEKSGQMWATLIVEQRVPVVIDLSHFSKTAARRWVMEFAEALYRANTEPLMLVVDEADVLIPQRLSAEMFRLLGAMEDIAKRGRQRGLGITVISQRVADVNKSVTDLLETLFLFAITGLRTRKAVSDWIDDHADPDEARAVVATLSRLPAGECWVWSPGWLHLLERVTFLRPETFDSHATPAPGQRRKPIKTVADIDLGAIKDAMAETIERAKADDPKALRAQIARLKKDLGTAQAAAPEPIVELVEVPVVTDNQLAQLQALYDRLALLPAKLAEALLPFSESMAKWGKEMTTFVETHPILMTVAKQPNEARRPPAAARPSPSDDRPKTLAIPATPRPVPEDNGLGKGELKLLSVLAHYPGGRSAGQLALLAGYSAKSSSIGTLVSKLRSLGLVEPKSPIRLTVEGLTKADPEPLPTGSELLEYWRHHERVGEGERNVLNVLVQSYPLDLTYAELCEATGYSTTSSSVGTVLARLRKLGLVEKGARRLDTDFADAIGR